MSFQNVIVLLGLVLPLLVPVGGALYQLFLHHLPANQRMELESVVQTVVSGVEQGLAGQSPDAKKQAAVSAVSLLAKQFHLNLNPSVVGMLIEAAVYELNQSQSYHPSALSQPVAGGTTQVPLATGQGSL